MNNQISIKTPIGKFVIDISRPEVVHVVTNNYLICNAIVYPATIHDLYGKQGHIAQGWTYATSVNESLLDKVKEVNNLLIPKEISLFRVAGGFNIN